jgi:carbamoyl-phosphate synthase large subunit
MVGAGCVIDSVLIIGSGPITIGQAAEFDYSGTQACLACREAGVRSILVNSNPATIQTDPYIADTVYIEPLTVHTISQLLARERPDGLIATVGGQTALNLAVALDEAGVLARYGVRVLGTGLEAIRRGEDRALFADLLRAIGQPVLPSQAVSSVQEALLVAERIGYPVMCRSAFALGGTGSGFARCPEELRRRVDAALLLTGSGQVLIEKSVYGWAEIEYEVIRDSADNCLIVCNMENIDPMGVHTGDSIVVAPSQTLSDEEYHMLRAAAIEVVRALGIEGACNIQFALDRNTGRYYVIEVNPRLSRSSALASKATGYPIAKVATRIALGYILPEIRNDITGTSAFFEPALDYVTVKIPRWPFDKLTDVEPTIGTSMRSTGEVMAIGRTFVEAMRKAIRSLDVSRWAVVPSSNNEEGRRSWHHLLAHPTSYRLPLILDALRAGWEPDEIARLSDIHPWFINQLAVLVQEDDAAVNGKCVFKMVDTCAAEFEARTPYFYGTHVPGGENEAGPLPGPKAIILGSGPIRIGQGIEFDYSTVHACHALSETGVRSIIINNNPETVSTDYSTSDRLYFEPLDIEAVAAVVQNEAEGLLGVIPQFGGQTAINLVQPLHQLGIPILGTPPEAIDAAEDRAKTSSILAKLGIPAPRWRAVERWEDLPAAIEAVGFPALLRPSYVLSGRGMTIVHRQEDVDRYLQVHAHSELTKPLLVDHFLEGAIELDVDAVTDGTDIVSIVMEQLEECGVHSGDSAEVYPVQTISSDILALIKIYTRCLAQAFSVIGLMNVQYAVLDGTVYVLEVNPRASRSVPFASKARGIPLADLAVRVILGQRLRDLNVPTPRTDRVCVKQVVLPFRRFPEMAPLLEPEMKSTGESMGIGRTFASAYWKAWLGAGFQHLPFGRPVYISAPTVGAPNSSLRGQLETISAQLAATGCPIIVAPHTPLDGQVALACAPREVDVSELGLAIVLDRSPEEIALLRRAVDAGVLYISTHGGLRGLALALREGEPYFEVEALASTSQRIVAYK